MSTKSIKVEMRFSWQGEPEALSVTDAEGRGSYFTPANTEQWAAWLLFAETMGVWKTPEPWPQCQGLNVFCAHRKRGGFVDGLVLFAVQPEGGFTPEQRAWLERAGAKPYEGGYLGYDPAPEEFVAAHRGQLCFQPPEKGSPLAPKTQWNAHKLREQLLPLLPPCSTLELEYLPYEEAYL